MTSITEIQEAILGLDKADYAQLRQWFNELDWENWDQRIEADSDAGKLDFLIDEVAQAKEQGALQDL